MRDLVLTAFVAILLPFCLARPWIGILAWTWVGLMVPQMQTWGFARGVPFAMLIAGATLAGILFTKDRKPIPWTREAVLLALLWGMFLLSTIFAIMPERAWDQLMKVSKILLFVFLTLMFFQDRTRLRYLYLVHRNEGGNPTETLLTDRPLLAAVGLWGVYCGAVIYLAR